MNTLLRFLFPAVKYTTRESLLLLALRLTAGGLLLSHGITKLAHFSALAATFPDPMGVGSGTSLVLALFAEVLCAAGCIVGLCYRLALLPMIFTMGMALFVVHAGDAFDAKELALVYLILFVLLFAAGPGAWAADGWIARRIGR